jgi:ankyrin repeat protein
MRSEGETPWNPDENPLNLSQYPYLHLPDAIVVAAHDCQGRLVQHLLESGTSIETRDEEGRTALMAACCEGSEYLISMLLDQGADPSAIDKDGDSPLDVARYLGHADIVAALVAKGAKGKEGPSQKELTDDAIYSAFDHANAVKRLVAMIDKQKTGRENSE